VKTDVTCQKVFDADAWKAAATVNASWAWASWASASWADASWPTSAEVE
jgi:hypothetical protein